MHFYDGLAHRKPEIPPALPHDLLGNLQITANSARERANAYATTERSAREQANSYAAYQRSGMSPAHRFLPIQAFSQRSGMSPELRYIPTQTSIAREPIARESIFGGSVLPRPPPMAGAASPSALAPASVFGGANGGMGASALGPTTLTGISSSVSKMGVGITNTLATLIPLAIKIILAVIVIKIVLWLVRGRRR